MFSLSFPFFSVLTIVFSFIFFQSSGPTLWRVQELKPVLLLTWKESLTSALQTLTSQISPKVKLWYLFPQIIWLNPNFIQSGSAKNNPLLSKECMLGFKSRVKQCEKTQTVLHGNSKLAYLRVETCLVYLVKWYKDNWSALELKCNVASCKRLVST